MRIIIHFCFSYDKHYRTSEVQSGLDLSLARLAFQKLATKDKVLTKVICSINTLTHTPNTINYDFRDTEHP